ncbi:MAG: Ppx/GppA family phosphatase [Gammaproteobacteria bacterium]|jgi:exopolyphosphatase / guanosine-5'-triphosphate,3'-diphosphate pyrophosphatase|nr:Ppx/GppA family phosphatase [Gammaproteobacteria bacterium]
MTSPDSTASTDSSSHAIAAVDLGSNSFHMIVAEDRQGQLVVLDRIKEMVRLASGLDQDGNLSVEVEQRALACLQRFSQRLRNLSSVSVSAVGTNTLRRTRHADIFLQRAEAELGHPIEVISGIEEARLIYQGVARSLEPDHKNRLVVDIGGGSTELIIGEDFQPILMESLDMGCITVTREYFPDGKITGKRINSARVFVLQQMRAVRHAFLKRGWKVAIGSSGTIRSVESVVRTLSLSKQDGVSFVALQLLLERLKQFDTIDSIKLSGLSDDRVPVFLGGLIVLSGVCEALGIKQMQVSDGALREGLLYQLMGRHHDHDIRNQSVHSLASRFHADVDHANRVRSTANDLLEQIWRDWSLNHAVAFRLLNWACELHEIGRDIAHSAYHKHSGYIIESADMAGFSQQEQKRIAALVRAHRGKLNNNLFESLNKSSQEMVKKLVVVLRLAVIFHRSRSDIKLPFISIEAKQEKIILSIPASWIEQHPLTLNDLEQEADHIQSLGIKLKVKTSANQVGNTRKVDE